MATTFNPGADPHNELATCVSLNTAVAARWGVDKVHKVTYEPDFSGGLQLLVDGEQIDPITLKRKTQEQATQEPGALNLDGGRIKQTGAPRWPGD